MKAIFENTKACFLKVAYLIMLACLAPGFSDGNAASFVLEGQSKGLTNWYAGNLQFWRELDYIPCRVRMDSAQGNQTFTIYFEHQNRTVPGVQNLFNFTCSPNVTFVSAPVLSAPAGQSTWSYTIHVYVADNSTAVIDFQARLAAGSHLNVGSSLALSGKPSSMGNLQIHKPSAVPGAPNLSVAKTGPALARPGDSLTYTLTYSNLQSAAGPATGAQLSDILPAEVSVDPASLPAGSLLVGNTLYWDLPGTLPAGATGSVSYQVLVNSAVEYDVTFTNFAQILSAENDADYSDNEATLVSRTHPCTSACVAISTSQSEVCEGEAVVFNTSATGSGPLNFQWTKDGQALAGATNSTLAIPSVRASDAGTYSVVVSNNCNISAATAVLSVNPTLAIASAPINVVTCPADNATFAVSATGTGLGYQWFKNGSVIAGQTANSLVLSSVSAADAGTYSVVVSGTCGNSFTNSATLVVNSTPVVTPMNDVVSNVGGTAIFNANAAGTGPFSFAWKHNGNPLLSATASSLVLSNVSTADAGTYTVQVTGACGTESQSANLTLNLPPTVTITSPTNWTAFAAPAGFSVVADAQDPDGTITMVEFFDGHTNLIGFTTNVAPYFVVTSELPAGTYTFVARATDNMGATGVSLPVTVTVTDTLPPVIASALKLNPQTGLFEQKLLITNPTVSTITDLRVYVSNLTTQSRVWNASGTNNGIAYVKARTPIAPGATLEMVVEYYITSRTMPQPVFTTDFVSATTGRITPTLGQQIHIDRGMFLADGTFLVEFISQKDSIYYVQYSSDLTTWLTAEPAVVGTGSQMQWIDNGQPRTISAPRTTSARFYRVLVLP